MGLVALKVGILLAYLGFRFIGQPADHKVAFWLVVAFLVAWLIAVIIWMNRTCNEWYNQ